MRKQAAVRQSDVLGVLHGHKKPMTAYAILDQMKLGEPDLAAPTVYRALAALTDQGLAHKLESIKAFVPCRCSHEAAVPVLAICGDCGAVEEHDGTRLLPELSAISTQSSFNATRHIVEIHGRCDGCSTKFPDLNHRIILMKNLSFLVATAITVTPVLAEENRQLDAHEHGVGQLDMAFDGKQIAMELHAPGADIVGFEYEAESAPERAVVDAAVATLAGPLGLFVLPDAAGCSVVQATAGLESEEEHKDDDHVDDEHADDDHAEAKHEDHANEAGRDGGGPGSVAYATSKGAVMTMTRGLAKEVGPDVRVNALCPGMIDTDFHNIHTPDAGRRGFEANAPMKRQGHVDDAANLIVFLASDDSAFITGTNIDLNGGMLFS